MAKCVQAEVPTCGPDGTTSVCICSQAVEKGDSDRQEFLSMLLALTDYDMFVVTMKNEKMRKVQGLAKFLTLFFTCLFFESWPSLPHGPTKRLSMLSITALMFQVYWHGTYATRLRLLMIDSISGPVRGSHGLMLN